MLPFSFLIPASQQATWPSNPVDGDLILNASNLTLPDGAVKTYRNITLINGANLYVTGTVVVGFTGTLNFDSTSAIIGDTNTSGNGYDGSGNPILYTYNVTAPDGTNFTYNVTGAQGGAGGADSGNLLNGGSSFYGFGGGGQSDLGSATDGSLGSGGEGSSSNQVGGGSGGSFDGAGQDGTTWPIASPPGSGGGGGGGGAGYAGSVFLLKGGKNCTVALATGIISFNGDDGSSGGNGGNGTGIVGINAGGGGGGAGGAGGYVQILLPNSQTYSWQPSIVSVSGGAGASGGSGGTGAGDSAGYNGSSGANGQNGVYTVVGYS